MKPNCLSTDIDHAFACRLENRNQNTSRVELGVHVSMCTSLLAVADQPPTWPCSCMTFDIYSAVVDFVLVAVFLDSEVGVVIANCS